MSKASFLLNAEFGRFSSHKFEAMRREVNVKPSTNKKKIRPWMFGHEKERSTKTCWCLFL